MKKTTLLFILLNTFITTSFGQTKRALFLGNSYTYVNDLPQMVADMATSTVDTLIFDSNTPGGYTLQGHSTNPTSLSKIALGGWDYVVLQEQSQLPSFEITQVQTDVFPYAHMLDSTINADNPCAETVFYMTWGRKNGDASNCAFWPPVCTYNGMDSLLNLRYRMMADSNNAIVSPAGAVWKHVRQNFPLIELYQADQSHPSVAGTYAAACAFYTAFYRKDPTLITFNSSLPAADAANIRASAKLIVYDSLMNWHIGEYDSLMNITCFPTMINNNEQTIKWNVYPNPTNTFINVDYELFTNEDVSIEITNTMGQLVYSKTMNQRNLGANSLKIETSGLPTGIYQLKLKTGKKEYVQKIAVMK